MGTFNKNIGGVNPYNTNVRGNSNAMSHPFAASSAPHEGSYFKNANQNTPRTDSYVTERNKKEQRLQKSLQFLGIAAVATLAVAGCKHLKQKPIKLSDITFNKGNASINGKAFTGEIKDTLKNGDKISLVYKDGIVQSSKREGSVNFSRVFNSREDQKILSEASEKAARVLQSTPAKKSTSLHIEELGNGRIKATAVNKKGVEQTLELPQYLYHMTSKSGMEGITADDLLRASQNEQLKGVYLFDSENFLTKYGQTNVNGQTKDLVKGIFKQAKNNGNPDEDLALIRIPTKNLLENGKLRIRKQEDFFTFKETLKDIQTKTGKTYTLRELCEDSKRAELKDLITSKKLMTEEETKKFFDGMTDMLHRGYTLPQAASLDLEHTHSIEYIFNHDIKLSEHPDIRIIRVKPQEYLNPSTGKYDLQKVRTMFDEFSVD